jgi:hypothetical protein
VAKKTRTPAPPRKVQAPQRRSDPRGPSRFSERRGLWLAVALAVVAVVAAIVAGVLLTRGDSSNSTAATIPNQSELAGLQTGPAPWNPGLDTLPDRLDPVGVHALSNEGQVLHIHQHLDIFVNGKHVTVPALIGIYDSQYITELHTHDTSGVMHVESPVKRNFTLGQFFGVWGVRLDSNCIGGYCKPKTPWRVYVNGLNQPGNPAELVLKKHQEIAMVIGDKRPKEVPSTYNFGGL